MKIQSILLSGLFAAITALPLSAIAADGDKAAEAKAKPHSHMTEKTGVEAKAPAATADKDAAKATAKKTEKTSKDKHLHPRDGK